MPTTFTTATQRLIQLAAELDLRPQADEAPYRGSIRIVLDSAEGPDSGYGAIYIGARTGRVLRLALRHGADDPRPGRLTRHVGYRSAHTALVEYERYARRMGLLPEPQDPEYIPVLSDEELAEVAAALIATAPMTVTSGRATWHAGIVTVEAA